MKHVIIIETPDEPKPDVDNFQKYQEDCIQMLEYISAYYFTTDNFFIQSAFGAKSALQATAKMFGIEYNPVIGEFK